MLLPDIQSSEDDTAVGLWDGSSGICRGNVIGYMSDHNHTIAFTMLITHPITTSQPALGNDKPYTRSQLCCSPLIRHGNTCVSITKLYERLVVEALLPHAEQSIMLPV